MANFDKTKYKQYIINKISNVASTNEYIKQLKDQKKVQHGTVILADYQTKGRGTGKNTWHSAPGKNLLFSVFFEINLNVNRHFMLNVIVSLAIIELLSDLDITARIKWPNDIYYNNRKLAGLLIENSIINQDIINSIIGVGLNVNQTSFPDELPNPVSLFQITGRETNIIDLLKKVMNKLDKYLKYLNENSDESLIYRYEQNLYRINEIHGFEDFEGNFNGCIRGISSNGELLVEDTGSIIKTYQFGEIKYATNYPDSD